MTPRQSLTTGTALRLLAEEQRRQVLRRIAETSDGTTVDRLAEDLGGTDSTASDGQFVDLHHVHLPKLQEADVIAYDSARGTVQRGPHFREVHALLHVIDDHRTGATAELS